MRNIVQLSTSYPKKNASLPTSRQPQESIFMSSFFFKLENRRIYVHGRYVNEMLIGQLDGSKDETAGGLELWKGRCADWMVGRMASC